MPTKKQTAHLSVVFNNFFLLKLYFILCDNRCRIWRSWPYLLITSEEQWGKSLFLMKKKCVIVVHSTNFQVSVSWDWALVIDWLPATRTALWLIDWHLLVPEQPCVRLISSYLDILVIDWLIASYLDGLVIDWLPSTWTALWLIDDNYLDNILIDLFSAIWSALWLVDWFKEAPSTNRRAGRHPLSCGDTNLR